MVSSRVWIKKLKPLNNKRLNNDNYVNGVRLIILKSDQLKSAQHIVRLFIKNRQETAGS